MLESSGFTLCFFPRIAIVDGVCGEHCTCKRQYIITLKVVKKSLQSLREADLQAVKPIIPAQYACSEDHWAVAGDERVLSAALGSFPGERLS